MQMSIYAVLCTVTAVAVLGTVGEADAFSVSTSCYSGGTGAAVSWSGQPYDVTSFDVKVSKDLVPVYEIKNVWKSTTSINTGTILTPGVEYLATVIAHNERGIDFKAHDIFVCKPPFSAGATCNNSKDATISWSNAPTGSAKYDVYVGGNKVGDKVTGSSISTDMISTPGTSNSAYVTAYDGSNNRISSTPTITFTCENSPPVVSITNKVVSAWVSQTAYLSGAAYDPDMDDLEISWLCGGYDIEEFTPNDHDSVYAHFQVPSNLYNGTEIVCTLKATDVHNANGTSYVTVTAKSSLEKDGSEITTTTTTTTDTTENTGNGGNGGGPGVTVRTTSPSPGTSTTPTFSAFTFTPSSSTISPHVVSIVRTGNMSTTDQTLVWNVTFSKPVNVDKKAHVNITSMANATIPDLGTIHDSISVGVPGNVTVGVAAVNLTHPIRSGLVIELLSPNCTSYTVHNQTHAFAHELQQPHDLEGVSGMEATGPWTLQITDMAKWLDGILNSWNLILDVDVHVEGAGTRYTFTQYAGTDGNHTLDLGPYDIRDRAGNPLSGADPDINEPYNVTEAERRTC